MLEGALCFPEPAWPSLVAPAAAAGTCGEVGGELGDLLSDALGLADRFSGCAPSLSCKNQNSTVSPAVTTLEIWVRERPPEEGREGGRGLPFLGAAATEVGTQTKFNGKPMHSDGRQGWWGTADEVHAHCPDQLIASKTGEQRIQTNKKNQRNRKFGCIRVQTTDVHMQNSHRRHGRSHADACVCATCIHALPCLQTTVHT